MNQLKRPAVHVDRDLVDTLDAAQEDEWAVVVKPPKDADGDVIDAGERMLTALHDEFDRFTIEIHQTDRGAIEFHFIAGSHTEADRIMQHVLSAYPRAEADIERAGLPIEAGDVVTVAAVEYSEDYLLPLRCSRSADAPDADPYRSLLDTMADARGDRRCVLQTVVEPTDSTWTTRWTRGLPYRREDARWWQLPTSRSRRWPGIEDAIGWTLLAAGGWFLVTWWFAFGGPIVTTLFAGIAAILCARWWAALFGNYSLPSRMTGAELADEFREQSWTDAKASRAERQTADTIGAQAGEDGYRVSMRLVTIADSDAGAREHQERLGSQLGSAWHDPVTGQRLTLAPVRPLKSQVTRSLRRLADRSPSRSRIRHAANTALSRARRRTPMFMSGFELGSLTGHLPDGDSGGKGSINYAPPRLQTRIPPAAGRYERPGEDTTVITPSQGVLDRLARAVPFLDERTVEAVEEQSDEFVPLAPDEFEVEADSEQRRMHDRYGEIQTQEIEFGDPHDPDDEDDVWMGAFFRELLESKQENPRDDIWIGYQERGNTVRECGIPFSSIFTHVFVQGATGQGKSTIAAAILAQWANAGYGFCLPDPSGELVADVLKWLPEHRKDDVVYFDPEPEDSQQMVGLNLLEIEAQPGSADYDATVDAAIDEVVSVLKDEAYWGQKMNGVVRNLARVMITSSKPFTFVDLHAALSDEEGRQELADKAGKDDEFVARYTQKIAEMDDDDLDALIRRINGWVESKVARQVIAHQDSTISIREAVEQEKIILVDNDVSKESIQRLIGVGIWRRVWRHCRNRPEDERIPYALLADEFDDFISDEMNVDEQVKNARKYRLSLILMTQYLSGLGNEDVEEAIDEECTTVISFRIKSRTGAASVAKMHGLDDREYLTKLERFCAIVEIEVERKPRGPFEISIMPPVPPVRTADEARAEIVEPALARDGTDMLSDQEIREQAVIGGDSIGEDGDAIREQQEIALKAAEDTAIREGKPGGYIPKPAIVGRLNDYLDEDYRNADEAWRKVLQAIPESQLAYRDREDGETEIKVLDRAWMSVGDSPTAGGRDHALVMIDAYQPLTQLGFVVDVLDQDGAANQSMPDGLAKPDDVLALDGLDPVEDAGEIADRVNEFRTSDDHDTIVRLTGVKDGFIEAEHSTTDTQPSQAIMNAIQAHNAGHRCLYLVRPELAEKLHGYLSDYPAGCRSNHDVPGEERFYTRTGALTIDGEDMTRPGSKNNVWVRDLDSGEIVLRDDSGTEHARFTNASDVFTSSKAYPGGGRTVTPPMIPDHELERGSMEDMEWDIIVVPHAEVNEDDERRRLTPLDLKLYQSHAEDVPLIDLPLSPAERGEDEQDMQAIADAIDDVANNMFEE